MGNCVGKKHLAAVAPGASKEHDDTDGGIKLVVVDTDTETKPCAASGGLSDSADADGCMKDHVHSPGSGSDTQSETQHVSVSPKGSQSVMPTEASDSLPPWKESLDDSPFYILRKTEEVTNKYFIAEELGHGQFGVVSVAVDKITSKKYAIKSISKRKAEADPNFRKDIRNEVEIMYHLGGHNNIVQLHEVYEDLEAIHLILELCEGGDWFERLLAHGTYSERQAAATARTVLETLAYCHSLGVVHRDLKPENLLLTDRTDKATVKLADFGLSALVPQTALQSPESKAISSPKGLLHDAVGSAYYVAPEVLMAHVYGKEVDIWSMGVVIYIALGGYPPFDGANEQQILRAVVYNPLRFEDPSWDEISASAKDIISRMLCKDPRRRATIPELLAHPWMNPARKSGSGAGPQRADSACIDAKAAIKSTRVPDTVVTRLQQFAAMNRFKKEARKVLATFLPEEEVVGLLSIFKEMDTDGDGVLTLAELRAAMHGKGIFLPEGQFKDLMNRVDLNSDGVLDYEEFLAATVHQLRIDKDEIMFKAFQKFDIDKSGFITVQELTSALADQGGHQININEILKEVDKDHDGRINYEEFCDYIKGIEQPDSGLGALIAGGAQPRRLLNSASGRATAPRALLNSMSTRPYDRVVSRSMNKSRGILKKPKSVCFRESHDVASLTTHQESGLFEGAPTCLSDPLQEGRNPNKEHRVSFNGAVNDRAPRVSFNGALPLTPEDSEEGQVTGCRAVSNRGIKASPSNKYITGARSSRLPSRQLVRDASLRDGGVKNKMHSVAARSGVIGRPSAHLPPLQVLHLPSISLPNSASSRSLSAVPCEQPPAAAHNLGKGGQKVSMKSREASYSRNHIQYREGTASQSGASQRGLSKAWAKDIGAELLLSLSKQASSQEAALAAAQAADTEL